MRMTREAKAWQDASCTDALAALADIEKDIPPAELAEYLASFERVSVPIRWNHRKGAFEVVKPKR